MHPFEYRNKLLYAEDVSLQNIANLYGTPCYVYSKAAIEQNYQYFATALKKWPTRICYAVKANSNLAVLNILVKLGSNFDIVSIGELERVLRAGGDASKVVFSGVAKRSDEIHRALIKGIYCFNIESYPEMLRIQSIASKMDVQANVSLRVNPDVNPDTHEYISTGLKENKFGIEIDRALEIYKEIEQSSHLNAIGIDCHIGSQLLDLDPFKICFEKIFALVDKLKDSGITIQHVDVGGGLGIQYEGHEIPPTAAEYAKVLAPFMKNRDLELLIEPGRAIVGNAGMLLTRVEHIKKTEEKNFALVDAAMNDFIRPALYYGRHTISEIQQLDVIEDEYDVVGPVCETGDFLAHETKLKIQEDSLLAVHSAGAYGFVMSSNYNSRVRAAEILVDGEEAYLIRRRETIEQLFENESFPT